MLIYKDHVFLLDTNRTECLTGRTPLFWTVLSKNVGAAKYLLGHGANQDKANHDGFSPLHVAVGSGLPL